VIRYGNIQVPRAAISELANELRRAGNARLAHRLGHVIDRNLEELSLGPEDFPPILQILSERPIASLDAFKRAVEAQFRKMPAGGALETARQKRMAANEAFFRALNERLEELTPDSELSVVVCECADEDCAQRLTLTHAEYEAVRADATQFVIAHGHFVPEIEIVVYRTDRFEVVRKLGAGAQVAIRLDAADDTSAPR
jgi:hypothetical protein